MILEFYRNNPLILASASPRRKELLTMIEVPFESFPSPAEEIFNSDFPEIQAERLACEKVRGLLQHDPSLRSRDIFGADTCIDLDGFPLGKPENMQQARDFLNRLSGRTHCVITGMVLYNGKSGNFTSCAEITEVDFISLSENEIDWYVASREWEGAAGAYRIQGKAALFVKGLRGCYYNVMGLPLHRFYDMICRRISLEQNSSR